MLRVPRVGTMDGFCASNQANESVKADWMTLSAPSGRVDLVGVRTTKARKKGAEQC
jgi:hypothetical protein